MHTPTLHHNLLLKSLYLIQILVFELVSLSCIVAPPSPVAPLDLTIADGFDENSPHISDAGLYVMNPTNTVPRETDSSLVRHLTMIIVRVGRVGAKKQKYMWMVGTLCSDMSV